MDDDLKNIWDDLSYSVQKKSDKIRQLKIDINTANKKSLYILAVGTVFGLYTMLSGLKYLNGVIPDTFRLVHYFDILIVLITIAFAAYLYLNFKELVSLKIKYESLRKNLIKAIEHEFCQHAGGTCLCKDTYIKGMEREDIDLIFN